jgi:hypothetical protein
VLLLGEQQVAIKWMGVAFVVVVGVLSYYLGRGVRRLFRKD